ncbi:hypothetical protein MN116_007662 [Schistosoma mekongi]|uniref:Uncharacterized protein n=1 Tax=Schistosoma mekongi TaxID=38744 RepID=A0AAE1Z7W7_SCHME|nr:hypothetical protein MN116_007662 [Schistosoma mekongi]
MNEIHYKCKCPYNTVTINTNLLWSTSFNNQPYTLVSTNRTQILNSTNMLAKTNKQQISGFCRGLLVDIGMFCNQVDMLCRSSNSFCSNGKLVNKVYISPQCVCRHGHLPIYQHYLGYHECVPICDKCNQMEQYSRQRHCACPDIVYSNKHDKEYEINETMKGNMLRFISIKQNFTICFNPSMKSLAFNFMNNYSTHLIVFMSNHPGSTYPHDNCILSIYEKERIWCKTFNFSEKFNTSTECATMPIYQTQKEYTFKIYITVLYQLAIDFTTRTEQYGISFTSKWDNDNVTVNSDEVRMLNVQYYTTQNNSQVVYMLQQNLQFTIRNEVHRQQYAVNKWEPIHLYVNYYHHNSSYKHISIEQCSLSEPSLHSVFNEVIIVRKNCLLHSSESSEEIKFNSNHLSTYGNFDILLNNDLLISNMRELFKNAGGNNSIHFNSKDMRLYPGRNFTVWSELQINCIFRVCQHFRWCHWSSYCSGLTKWSNHNLFNSYLSEDSLYPAIHTLTRSLKIKVPDYNQSSPSDSSSTFVQAKNINSNREPDAVCIKFSKAFTIFIICLVSVIAFTIVLHNQLNSITCQHSYSTYCPPFHQPNKPSNHKNCNKNELSNNEFTTYSLYINPIKTKTSQFTHDNDEDCKHQSSSLNIQYNPINNNDMYKAQSPRSYQCFQLYPYTSSSEIINNKINHSYQNNMMTTSIQYNENDIIQNKITPICCKTQSNLYINESKHNLSRSLNDEMYHNHIHQIEFNKTYKDKSSTLSTFSQQPIHSVVPDCLQQQIMHTLPYDSTNTTKYDNNFIPTNSIEYSRNNNNNNNNNSYYDALQLVTVNNHLFINNNEHIEQEFNV